MELDRHVPLKRPRTEDGDSDNLTNQKDGKNNGSARLDLAGEEILLDTDGSELFVTHLEPVIAVKAEEELDLFTRVPHKAGTDIKNFVDSKGYRSRHCPYLDTINRTVLDFDFEKLCSVSLSHLNVYACLVCGKYFQGRGQNSFAYTHSIELGHHVFINLHTLKFYCLPDNYEVVDSSLDDIKRLLQPTFTRQQISSLDGSAMLSRTLDGNHYLPGVVCLNNIKKSDYLNAVLHALMFVPPLRDYFLDDNNYTSLPRPPGDVMWLLVQRFGELVRKVWNPNNFRAHVSPHEMLQAVTLCSRKRFQFIKQGDPIEFLSWFLNSIHLTLNGTQKHGSSIIYQSFQGKMNVYTKILPPADSDLASAPQSAPETLKKTPFLYLTLDLEPPPLYKDDMQGNIIPQVPIQTLLRKFDGISEKEYHTFKETQVKRFQLTALPKYLLVYLKRFNFNYFFTEKNPTIVNFPVKGLDLSDLLSPEARAKYEAAGGGGAMYDLVANVCHHSEPGSGQSSYSVQVYHKGSKQWSELQDLHLREILPPMITLSESYIQVWERKCD